MVDFNGYSVQTGNAFPNTAKKILRALCHDGGIKGNIHKGKQLTSFHVVEGNLHPNKEYYFSYENFTCVNPDVILRNSYDQLAFLYQI